MMTEWQPIESAPLDGTPVRLKSPLYEPDSPFHWDGEFGVWRTTVYAIARAVEGWWDEDCEQPTHWKGLTTSAL